MIEDFVCHARRNAQPGHPGHAGPAQVMEAPPGHTRESIKPTLGTSEVLERLGSEQCEDKWPSLICVSTDKLAGLGIDRGDVIAALRAQNVVNPAGILQTGDERLALRVSGAFGSELDILAINIASNGRLIRLGDIAEIRRVYVDPPQPIFRVNGKPAIGVAIAMRDGGDILTLGRNVQRTMDAITAALPVGIEPVLVADQSSVVRGAIGEFMTSLWQAIAIIMAVSVLSLGVRAGAIVALSIPPTPPIVFPAHP